MINPDPIIEATKVASVTDTNGNGVTDLGDVITYTITVENKGNVTLSGLTLVDTLKDGDGDLLTITNAPSFISARASSLQGTLTVGEIATYTATFTINQQALDSGRVVNTVLATASSPGQSNNVTDRSDNGNDSDGETEDDETVTLLNRTNLIEATKVASVTDNNSNGVTDLGDTITYTITAQNKGTGTL